MGRGAARLVGMTERDLLKCFENIGAGERKSTYAGLAFSTLLWANNRHQPFLAS
jgi:hypothetical protein